ncbi:unnamed protein product [Rhizophagus irregularis]|nr:unnamed protein product [Rhizophagus irregularis]
MKYEFIEVYSAFLTCSSVTDMDKSDFAYLDIRRNIEPILCILLPNFTPILVYQDFTYVPLYQGSGISNFTVYMILSYLSDPVILDVIGTLS